MAWTPTTFKARWPEFAPATDATVNLVLAEAGRRCDARAFGDAYDDAVGLMAAHLLASSPGGMNARLEADPTLTTYLAEWQRLARARLGGPRTIGV